MQTTTTRKQIILLSSIIIILVVVALLVTLISNNNAYANAEVEESQIEIRNLTGWQWDQVKYSMNFTGIEIPDYVKNGYDIVINNDNDDDNISNNNDKYCYTSKCLIQEQMN